MSEGPLRMVQRPQQHAVPSALKPCSWHENLQLGEQSGSVPFWDSRTSCAGKIVSQ